MSEGVATEIRSLLRDALGDDSSIPRTTLTGRKTGRSEAPEQERVKRRKTSESKQLASPQPVSSSSKAVPVASPSSQRPCRPWDADDFADRVRSYTPTLWFGKPLCLSPLWCARFGWRAIAVGVVCCDWCGVTVGASASLARNLQSKDHANDCLWRHGGVREEFSQLPGIGNGLVRPTALTQPPAGFMSPDNHSETSPSKRSAPTLRAVFPWLVVAPAAGKGSAVRPGAFTDTADTVLLFARMRCDSLHQRLLLDTSEFSPPDSRFSPRLPDSPLIPRTPVSQTYRKLYTWIPPLSESFWASVQHLLGDCEADSSSEAKERPYLHWVRAVLQRCVQWNARSYGEQDDWENMYLFTLFLISACGWQPASDFREREVNVWHCERCQRRLKFFYHATERLDPIRGHRHFCPYVQSAALLTVPSASLLQSQKAKPMDSVPEPPVAWAFVVVGGLYRSFLSSKRAYGFVRPRNNLPSASVTASAPFSPLRVLTTPGVGKPGGSSGVVHRSPPGELKTPVLSPGPSVNETETPSETPSDRSTVDSAKGTLADVRRLFFTVR